VVGHGTRDVAHRQRGISESHSLDQLSECWTDGLKDGRFGGMIGSQGEVAKIEPWGNRAPYQ
jgi:hypothetical protein